MKTIRIYSKSYCPYCVEAKRLLDQLEIPYETIDVTDDAGTLIEISAKSGMRTVPQIWADDECLGGYSDLLALCKSGELDGRIRKILS
ncbi:MAG TPA: glutaredoxin domain-containing protein [bacterium]|mgnify:CR=1 FL=1|nr:glutaredoxin domain-containing protein [bacterium]